MTEDVPSHLEKGRKYRYENGTVEVVFATEDGHVLTVREYPSTEGFEEAVENASDIGTHQPIADLPGVEAFSNEADRPTGGDRSDRSDGS